MCVGHSSFKFEGKSSHDTKWINDSHADSHDLLVDYRYTISFDIEQKTYSVRMRALRIDS
jgi:hypothetical protein